MGASRDNFTAQTKQTLLERAGGRCTNPDCRELTLKPASHPEKSIREGVAAHIHAASPGGPRHNPDQSPEERTSIENGIWLCRECAWRVDQEPEEYTPDLLREWKERHRAWILQDGGLEPLPELRWQTHDGLRTLGEGETISGDEIEEYRDHTLRVRNPGSQAIEAVVLRIQYPEMLHPIDAEYSPHNDLGLEPDRAQMVASASEGGKISIPSESNWFENYRVHVGLLHPQETLEVSFRSTPHEHMGPTNMESVPPSNDREPALYHVEGTCIIAGGQRKFHREIIAPFEIDTETRQATLQGVFEKPVDFQVARQQAWHA